MDEIPGELLTKVLTKDLEEESAKSRCATST